MAMLKVAHRYPRRGERIAPRTLQQLLLEPIPPRLQVSGNDRERKLSDLDAIAWDHFSLQAIEELAERIVKRVGSRPARKVFQHWPFPRPPAGTRLEDLLLETRTRRCLSRQGLDDHLEELGDRTFGEILSIPAFGTRCLVDLLAAIESLQQAGLRMSNDRVPAESRSDELTAAAARLADLAESRSACHDDRRFARLMRAVDVGAHTASELADRLLARRQDPPDPAYVAEQVRELCHRIQAMAEQPMEQELIDIFAPAPGERNAQILIGYYGWDDGCPHTLTEIGERFGITRERVRQVCAKFTKKPRGVSTIPAPALDRALALVAARLPCSAARLEAELIDARLTSVGMSIEALAAGAKLLGRAVHFKVVKIEGEKGASPDRAKPGRSRESAADRPATLPSDNRLVIAPDQLDVVLATVDLAKKEIYFHGLSTVEQIARRISAAGQGKGAKSKQPMTAVPSSLHELTRQTLMRMDGFSWLDEATGWFRLLGTDKHGLPKAIDKMLAVAGTVTAAQLGTALGRNRRLWKEPPPEKVLLAFCRQTRGVRVEGDRIISVPPRDWKKSLRGVEAKLVAVLQAHGPVMERGAMEDLCVERGMNRFSFHAFISWSPVIAQYGHNLYGLLGAEVTPQQLDKLRAERRAQRPSRRVLDRHGWTDDGKVWLSYRLSKAASTYAVITVPAALKKVVHGRFELLAPDGRAIGTLATKDGRAWGLGAFLRKQSARIGDHIILTLDLEKRTAVVSWDEKRAEDEVRDKELRPR